MKRNRTPSDSAEQRGAQLTWAIAGNGEPAHISEVEKRAEVRVCLPGVRRSPRREAGEIREHHFAHASGRRVPARRGIGAAPRGKGHPREAQGDRAARGRGSPARCIAEDRARTATALRDRICEGRAETATIIPDVIVEVSGRQLLVEVTVTHGVDDAKLTKIRELGWSCVEIDLSDAPRDLGREALEKIVVDGSAQKRWLHNVRANEARNKRLSEATLLPSVERGFAWQVDGCPIPARAWKGKPYANVIDDCIGCEHMLAASGDVGGDLRRFPCTSKTTPTSRKGPPPATRGVRTSR